MHLCSGSEIVITNLFHGWTAFYNYLRSKLKTKETVGPIEDGDVMVHDDVGVATTINDYFSSVFTNG